MNVFVSPVHAMDGLPADRGRGSMAAEQQPDMKPFAGLQLLLPVKNA